MTDTNKLTVIDVFGTESARKETLDLILNPGNSELTFASQAELGKHLIEKALGSVTAKFHATVISYVEDLMNKIRTSELTRQACERNIAFNKARLEAIHKGEFSIHPITGAPEFTDPRLNETR